MLERAHLAIVAEVDKCGTLTEAAEKLCLTQSALSHAIKKLEGQLGTPIWEKQGRALRFTTAGLQVLSLANRLLPQFSHTESLIAQIAQGQRGTLRIGMECHPCYQWLLQVVEPYLEQWPDIDVDVKQKFQFGGIGALFAYDIDILITPDPLLKLGLRYHPVFDYELCLVVNNKHELANAACVEATDLLSETLITYPVESARLDIFSQFLIPAGCRPKSHKTIETTDIMLQMVASGRGVTALPRWLVEKYAQSLPIVPVSIGPRGIHKQIFVGTREADMAVAYINGFVDLASTITITGGTFPD